MLCLQVYSYSSYNQQETLGECTEDALAGRDVRWVKPRAPKEPKERAPVKQTGIPAEEGEDLGIEYRCVQTSLWGASYFKPPATFGGYDRVCPCRYNA